MTPGACTPTVGNNSRFNCKDINSTKRLFCLHTTILNILRSTATITCDDLTQLVLTSRTMRMGTVAFSSEQAFFT
ncbi:DUF1120 domain-containing protein [Burkholderia cepacia]|uniref:DUF1120 domain-containing protein n=1 Tax=Burkholderia cepacia TaxID=292 RepID=UPI0009C02EC5